MNIPKEYTLVIIVGLFLLAYMLDLVVVPLQVALPTPYHFFQMSSMSAFPFSTASVFIKAAAVFLAPLWLASFLPDKGYFKPVLLFVVAILLQLYAIQDIVTKTELIPVEWALSFTLAGLCLLLPAFLFFIRAFLLALHDSLNNTRMKELIKQAQEETKNQPSEPLKRDIKHLEL